MNETVCLPVSLDLKKAVNKPKKKCFVLESWKNYFQLFSVTQVLVYSWMRRWIKLAISNPTQSLLSSLCPPSTFVKVTQCGGFKLRLCFRQNNNHEAVCVPLGWTGGCQRRRLLSWRGKKWQEQEMCG